MVKHVEQHRRDDYFKTYMTDKNEWLRPESHDQGGELHGIWVPRACTSVDGTQIQCRHCDEYKKDYLRGAVNVPKMAKRIGHMRSHEAKCSVRKSKNNKG